MDDEFRELVEGALRIQYVTGDAVECSASADPLENKIIAHIVNDYGGWGRGFVVPLRNKYPSAEGYYRLWAQGNGPRNFYCHAGEFGLGQNQEVRVAPTVMVVNMCAQKGDSRPDYRAVQYPDLRDCLCSLWGTAAQYHASVHMPRIGCELGGGNWDDILHTMWESYLQNNFPVRPINTYVYDLPTRPARGARAA